MVRKKIVALDRGVENSGMGIPSSNGLLNFIACTAGEHLNKVLGREAGEAEKRYAMSTLAEDTEMAAKEDAHFLEMGSAFLNEVSGAIHWETLVDPFKKLPEDVRPLLIRWFGLIGAGTNDLDWVRKTRNWLVELGGLISLSRNERHELCIARDDVERNLYYLDPTKRVDETINLTVVEKAGRIIRKEHTRSTIMPSLFLQVAEWEAKGGLFLGHRRNGDGRFHGLEDRIGVAHDPRTKLSAFVVADGIGGSELGEVAAHITVQELFNSFQDFCRGAVTRGAHNPRIFFEDSVRRSHAALWERWVKEAKRRHFSEKKLSDPMGTCFAAGLLYGYNGWFINGGDVLPYLIRNDVTTQIAWRYGNQKGVVSCLIARGDPPPVQSHPTTPRPWRFGNVWDEPRFEVVSVRFQPGDYLLIATDGLEKFLLDHPAINSRSETFGTSEDGLVPILNGVPFRDVLEILSNLDRNNTAPADDNIGYILVRFR